MLKRRGLLARIAGPDEHDVSPKKKGTREFSQVPKVEAAGIASASQIPQVVSRSILASKMVASACTMSALTRHYGSLSQVGTA